MEQVRERYAAVAEQYIELFGRSAEVHADDRALIGRHLSIRPGAVLDLGCGPGHLTAYLRSLDVDAFGMDLVPEFIHHARTAFPEGRFGVGSLHRLPVPDSSAAGVLAWYSLIHLPPGDLEAVLVEMRRAMAHGGALVAGFFEGEEIEGFEHKVLTAFYWPMEEFAVRLRRAGFTVVERQRRSGDPRTGVRAHAAIAAIAS